jgi:hypothetical protein
MANLSIKIKGALALFLVVAAVIATHYDSRKVCFVVTAVVSSGCLAAATVLFSALLVFLIKHQHFLNHLLPLPYNSRITAI